MNFNKLSSEQITEKIKGQNGHPPFQRYSEYQIVKDLRRAAVLIPLFKKNDEWHVLYIRRATIEGDFHSGQVAFPGGAMEAQDKNIQETAVRETNEEIGLPKESIRVLGLLRDHITISGFQITPVPAIIPASNNFIMAQNEVKRVFSIPLNWLADPDNTYLKDRILPDGSAVTVRYFKEYDGENLWGATARITLAFIDNLH